MKRGPTLQCKPGLHYSVDLPTQTLETYTELIPLNYIWKTRHKISVDIQIVLQCVRRICQLT